MPRVSPFQPPWWLRNRHVQTIVANTLRPLPRLVTRRERFELPDGDFVDADWTTGTGGPVVLVLHGLEGSIRSSYAAWMLRRLHDAGYRGVLLHFRGCSGEVNRKAGSYHSGHTADFDVFVRRLRDREPDTPMAAIGYSLGGNVLLKWLADHPGQGVLQTAVAVSVPFDLAACARAIDQGFAKVYQWRLMRRLLGTARRKLALLHEQGIRPRLGELRTFAEFDEAITAPLHGFAGAQDYYAKCSSKWRMGEIKTRTLVLHSLDDPFMTRDTPPASHEVSPQVELEVSEHGGHVGFIAGGRPWKPEYWLETRILAHLDAHLDASPAPG